MKCLKHLSFSVLTLFIIFEHMPYASGNIQIHRAVPGSSNTRILKDSTKETEKAEEEDISGNFIFTISNKADSSWLCAIIASIVVGSTGIFPLFIFKVEDGQSLKESISSKNLKLLLSFAVGGLLGDVFLHLLPEAWMYIKDPHDHMEHMKIGLWVIAGILSFLIIEKIFMEEEKVRESIDNKKEVDNSVNQVNSHKEYTGQSEKDFPRKNGVKNGHVVKRNGCVGGKNGHISNGEIKNKVKESLSESVANDSSEENLEYTHREIKVIGYLNLLANCSDNFTHGLAVAGSFSVGIPVGICTTIAIMMHEIPHEIGDFAILLKAGLNRWEAAKGQMITASGALFGCMFGLVAESAGDASSWILPYTSGGFLYIAMVTLVPDLVKEDNFRDSMKQIFLLFSGIFCMAYVSTIQHN